MAVPSRFERLREPSRRFLRTAQERASAVSTIAVRAGFELEQARRADPVPESRNLEARRAAPGLLLLPRERDTEQTVAASDHGNGSATTSRPL